MNKTIIPVLAMLVLSACSDSTGEAADTTLAATTTASETTTTTAPPTTTEAITTTSRATTTSTALEGLGPFQVKSTVVSHETTQDIWVWAPDAEGSWPIVYALHGTGGSGEGFAVTASELASHGNVVFAPDWGSEADAECGYRYSLTIAEEYGGDSNQPITSIGHSLGASSILVGGLDDDAYAEGGTYDECFEGGPRPSVLVPISGCHYEYQGNQFGFDPVAYSDQGVEIVLVVGTDDTECEPWQSQDATDDLQAAGYDARLVEIDGGTHFTVIFHDLVNNEWLILPDDPTGRQVVDVILEAIEDAGS